MRTHVAVLSAVLLAGCQPTSSDQASVQQQGEAAGAAVASLNANWVRYVHENKPDSIGSLYTTDGIMMPPDVPAAVGRDSIAARARPLIIPGAVLTLTNAETNAYGNDAITRGTWTYSIPAQGGNPAVNLKGKYIEHVRNVNGQWLIAKNIWNSDTPPTPPVAPARGARR